MWYLLGTGWTDHIRALPPTQRYAQRVREVGSSWSAGFVAHHYTLYLGGLSGGQLICRVMRRRFGFDRRGVEFYLFDDIDGFKDDYRARLDSAAWSELERARVIDEVLADYQYNLDIFSELFAARDAKTAS